MNITDLCLRRPVFAWMMMFATIMFGMIALGIIPGATGIGVSQFPDVNNPVVTVSVAWTGASPEDIETGVVNPIEDVLAQVTGVIELDSQSKPGTARVTVTFDIDRDIDLAVQDVQAKIAQIQRQMPLNVQPPTVSKSNPDDTPIMTVGVSGPFSRQMLADVARYQLQDALTTLDGVGQVTQMGYIDRAVRIWVDADKLIETQTTVTDLTAALAAQHVTSSGGQMTNGQKAIDVRVLGEAADLDTLRNIVIKKVGSGIVHLGDVALVQDGFEDETTRARANGQPTQAMGILKAPGSNAVSVAARVRAAIGDLQKTLKPGMKLSVLFDTTDFIKESVNEIGLELVLAVILTAIVCWLFLGSLSSTLNVLFAIPMSLLGTIAVLYFLHWTLNTFTLLGLSLAVGLVVDDAVMVMENIYRHAEMGKIEGPGGERGHQGDHVRRARRDDRRDRDLLAGRVHERRDRQVLLAIRRDAVGRRRDLVLRGDHARTGALRADAQRHPQQRLRRPCRRRDLRPAVPRLRAHARARAATAGARRARRRRRDVRRVVRVQTAQAGNGAEPGPEPPADQAHDDGRLRHRRDRSARQAGRSRAQQARRGHADPVDDQHRHRDAIGDDGDPKQRKVTQQQFSATIRRELQQIPGIRVAVQDLSQQGFGAGKGKPLELACAARTGTASSRCRSSSRTSSTAPVSRSTWIATTRSAHPSSRSRPIATPPPTSVSASTTS